MLGGLGAVLHQGAGVDVQPVPGRPGPVDGQSPGQLGPAALEEAEAGLGCEVPGKGQPEAETAGVVGAGRLVGIEEVLEEFPTLIGDPVHLPRALGAAGRAGSAGPEPGPLTAQ